MKVILLDVFGFSAFDISSFDKLPLGETLVSAQQIMKPIPGSGAKHGNVGYTIAVAICRDGFVTVLPKYNAPLASALGGPSDRTVAGCANLGCILAHHLSD